MDQFLCVVGISRRESNSRIVISKYYDLYYTIFEYLPKEMFNMVQIDTIHFWSFTGGCHYHICLPKNHYLCKWNNLVNFKNAEWLHLSLYEKSEDGRICMLRQRNWYKIFAERNNKHIDGWQFDY